MSRRPERGSWSFAKGFVWTLALAWLLFWGVQLAPASAQTGTSGDQDRTFGASYDDLSSDQRALIDGFFLRAGAILGVRLEPRQRYNSAPLSSRTTFDAVTHALLRSVLTDRASGQPLGRTLDLIDHIELA